MNSLIKEPCGSLIELRKSENPSLKAQTVHFVYFSVKEYLLKVNRSSTLGQNIAHISFSDPATEHDLLARLCLTYLSYKELEPIGPRQRSCPEFFQKFQFLKYASKFWATHVSQISVCSDQLI